MEFLLPKTTSLGQSVGWCRRTDGKRFKKAWYVGNFKDMNQCQAKCEADKNCGYYDWHNQQSKHYGVCHLFMKESDGHTLKGEGHKWGFCNQKPSGSTSTGLVTYKHTTILGETYVGCFVDQGRRDLPKLLRAGYGNYKTCF